MALEWIIISCTAGAEAVLLLLLTLPTLARLRPNLVSLIRNALKPMISVFPFCVFLLLDIYWTHETGPICGDEPACTVEEHLLHQKSILKSQRNAILVASALLFNWLLLAVTRLVVHIDHLSQAIEKLEDRD